MTDEEFVRAAWKDIKVWVRDLDSYGTDQFNVEINPSTTLAHRWQEDHDKAGIKKVWSEARKYTDEHADKIMQVREEIALLRSMVILLRSEPEDLTAPVYERTLARLQADLDEMLKGWRQ